MVHFSTFAINRITAPTLSVEAYLNLCHSLAVGTSELCNDLSGIEVHDDTNCQKIVE